MELNERELKILNNALKEALYGWGGRAGDFASRLGARREEVWPLAYRIHYAAWGRHIIRPPWMPEDHQLPPDAETPNLSDRDLEILNNALNETLYGWGAKDTDFFNRMDAHRDEVWQLNDRIHCAAWGKHLRRPPWMSGAE
jgi:hypothetical protein